MGYGDELIGSGMARGTVSFGCADGLSSKRIAFGDGRQIKWSKQAYEIFQGNSKIARPGDEGCGDLKWIEHYQGRRCYGHFDGTRWRFKPYACVPGEVFLTPDEWAWATQRMGRGICPSFVVIEPRVKDHGACVGHNKQWPVLRYQAVANELTRTGYHVVQLVPPDANPILSDVQVITTPTFRHALAIMERSALYIGPEGGLHHGAAAMGTDAVVIWGGFNTPLSTGYSFHHNITVGEPCGRFAKCPHCHEAMKSISVQRVVEAAWLRLGEMRL